MSKQITHKYLVENGLILFETIIGSQAYGTHTPTSDIDKKFVYILPQDYILGTGYVEQINVNKDYVGWEIRRFLELMGSNNPTVLELLNTPEDCIIYKDPIFDMILENRDKFITKMCANSFGGYARQQIGKAKGQNKKQNWEKDKITRKEILDFCYVIEGHDSIPLTTFLKDNNYQQEFCGVVNIPNARDMYALYQGDGTLGYKGLVKVGDSDNAGVSNQLRLSSIPKGEIPIAVFTYNKDGYSQHCKDYASYQ